MKQLLTLGILLSCLVLASQASSESDLAYVTNGNNEGVGSLRAGLVSGASTIHISHSVGNIIISETLSYTGSGEIAIYGKGQTIDGSGIVTNDDILSIENGANLTLSNLAFVGNYTRVNDDASLLEGGKGIYVNVPLNRTAQVLIHLVDVSITQVGNHGVHVSDCSLGDDCTNASGGVGDVSPASIYVQLNNILVNRVGFGQADADGIRVDDLGEGSIYLSAINSKFLNVGGDGIELDEANDGSVVAYVEDSLFDRNGEYCNLIPFVEGSPCDDDGDADLDDGFDIDEAGEGSLYAYFKESKVTNNFDEGLDFDEKGGGNIEVQLSDFYGARNKDEAIKMSEANDGNIKSYNTSITIVDNNGDGEGIELEETGAGNVRIRVVDSNMMGGEDEQLKVAQDDDGTGTIHVIDSIVDLDLDGVVAF